MRLQLAHLFRQRRLADAATQRRLAEMLQFGNSLNIFEIAQREAS
jgi:hypothetical protein